MENLEELEESTAVEMQDCLVDNGVLECATQFAQTFTPCDEPLRRVPHGGSTMLLEPIKPYRGTPALGPKRKLLYQIDDPDQNEITIFVDLPVFAVHRCPTIRFFSIYAEFPDEAAQKEIRINKVDVVRKNIPCAKIERTIFHPVSHGCMRQSGLATGKADKMVSRNWVLHWGGRFKDKDDGFANVLPFQRINHFPGTWLLGRKDNLARCIQKCCPKYPKEFDFHPMAYIMPKDMPLLQRDVNKGGVFIVKPPASARGKGITLFTRKIPNVVTEFAAELSKKSLVGDEDKEESEDEEFMVQRYCEHPLLVNGYKCDLRVYVCCTSFNPLTVYVYNEGLVRFATQLYDPNNLDNTLAHLTNYSLNKASDNYNKVDDAENDGMGSKWSLHALKRYFEEKGWDWELFWGDVEKIVAKTFISCEGSVAAKMGMFTKHHYSCFELYGFDIFVSDTLKPQLIEVNVLPSLACGSALDKHIKGNMVADLLNLVGVGVGFGEKMHNNAQMKSTKNVRGAITKLQSDKNYFSTATEDEKALLRTYEEECRRCGAWNRVIPTLNSAAEYGALFESKRCANLLLWRWEAAKAEMSPEQLLACVDWLAGLKDFPAASKPVSAVLTKKASVVVPPRAASSTRVEKFSAPARFTANPKWRKEKAEVEAPVAKKVLPVTSFTFI